MRWLKLNFSLSFYVFLLHVLYTGSVLCFYFEKNKTKQKKRIPVVTPLNTISAPERVRWEGEEPGSGDLIQGEHRPRDLRQNRQWTEKPVD